MSVAAHILVVDDEPAIRRLLCTSLERAGYGVCSAGSAREAMGVTAAERIDLVLLDLGLPDRDGLELIPILRSSGSAVIVVSARDATEQKVAALDLGANDYVTKPFDSEEVLARIRSALRTRLGVETSQPLVTIGDLEIDLARRQVRKGGREIHLTPREYALIAELAKRPGCVVTHAHLLKAVWGIGHEHDVEYLRVAARSLRLKIEDDPAQPRILRNDPGIGYRLVEASAGSR
ncbi:MAG: response regulator transcription factor [Sphingomonadales bacterium]|nr:response regulator transcription factor [Sphingomonadales bacterium]